MSYSGSARRIWRLVGLAQAPAARVALGVAAVSLISLAWVVVTAWYLLFEVLLIPYRLIRRSSRSRKRQALQHREMLDALNRGND